jgi:hypothetical protein
LIIQLDRKKVQRETDENCDPACALTGEEKKILIGLLSNEQNEPLVYEW